MHGGGKLATKLAEQLNIPQKIINGRRITDEETLKIVTMVYAGYINKNIVARLQAHGCNAIGLTGADGNAILAHTRISHSSGYDYGFAGDIDAINVPLIQGLLEQKFSLVIAPITHNKQGQLLNTNADTIAQEVAKALSASFHVQLIYLFEKNGVLGDINDDTSAIKQLNPTSYKVLKEKQIISSGMIPKIDNAFAALNGGVKKVVIGKAENLNDLIAGISGTTVMNG